MKIIVYYRVSTRKQEASGLGLAAQRSAIDHFAAANNATIVAEYREIETGKRSDRPVLQEAIQHARLADATLVVAKLDRLARNVAFISALMEAKVPFVCCDNPNATPLTIHILAAVAEDEARAISRRTKEGLAEAKRKGVKLGSQDPRVYQALKANPGWKKGSLKGVQARARIQRERYGKILPIIAALQARGPVSLREIADHLNEHGYVTSRGTKFLPSTVMRILRRQLDLASTPV